MGALMYLVLHRLNCRKVMEAMQIISLSQSWPIKMTYLKQISVSSKRKSLEIALTSLLQMSSISIMHLKIRFIQPTFKTRDPKSYKGVNFEFIDTCLICFATYGVAEVGICCICPTIGKLTITRFKFLLVNFYNSVNSRFVKR